MIVQSLLAFHLGIGVGLLLFAVMTDPSVLKTKDGRHYHVLGPIFFVLSWPAALVIWYTERGRLQ